ncbi:MAG: bifunctional proline dehydrogenase/L-glutamate gamma-semialdehyde dehydrogenase PutA [Pseudomonadota bacterium]
MSDALRNAIERQYRSDETASARPLLAVARLDADAAAAVRSHALALARRVREHRPSGGIDALLREYDLSTQEGVLLMCLAEALLRIPDEATAERLIRDTLARGHWDRHLGHSESLLVNASTWGLVIGGRVLGGAGASNEPVHDLLRRLAGRLGEGALRVALGRAMRLLADEFVLGTDLPTALARVHPDALTRYSFDCLGEAAQTAADARAYLDSYHAAIAALAPQGDAGAPLRAPGISVKLSALHPRYEFAQAARVRAELGPRLLELAQAARRAGIGLTLDAEEADRLDLMLDLFEQVYRAPELDGWPGLGLAVQAYQKRARAVIAWLIELARQQERRIPVRLVKGAYWDSEIKRAQERGLDGYPVYTRKAATDVCYLACARDLLAARDIVYPQFATHNAYTLAYLLHSAGRRRDFEFQRLHGMGEDIYAAVNAGLEQPVVCRVYAPVGPHDRLLPYLVRRLLENGANTSFVNRLARPDVPLDALVQDPVTALEAVDCTPHPKIPLPAALYGTERRNSRGTDLSDRRSWSELQQRLERAAARSVAAAPLIDGEPVVADRPSVCFSPADRNQRIGSVVHADADTVSRALERAAAQAPAWDATPAGERAAMLERAADLLEERAPEFAALCVREGGRCIPDALNEVREAVDCCRYYARRARVDFAEPRRLAGPTGEDNRLGLHGRGVFLCISPWNFPLAIFTGQVAAALAAGNAVLAKPARQTPLVAFEAVRLLHEAGVPPGVLQFLPGSGADIGRLLLGDARIAGVAFTGSTETAWTLQQRLAERRGSIVPLIAETGGQNAMIVDSSALVEQVIADVIASAFNSTGQRCSALRVLFLQEEIAERTLERLTGAMDELRIGDPLQLSTDIGPLIDELACGDLVAHAARMHEEARLIKRLTLPDDGDDGCFFAPHVFEIERLDQLDREIFGPILHAIRYPAGGLDRVIDAINATGYGLTLGVHSRIAATWERVCERARVGNIYVNRNMIGAVVGVQPFGGEGLSGTGPKAGGPFYLHRFATERTVSINTAAIGGNADLLGDPG